MNTPPLAPTTGTTPAAFAPGEFARIRAPSESVPEFARGAICAVIGPASDDIPHDKRESFRRVVIVRGFAVLDDNALDVRSFIGNVHVSILAPLECDEHEWLEATVLREVIRAMGSRLFVPSPEHAAGHA